VVFYACLLEQGDVKNFKAAKPGFLKIDFPPKTMRFRNECAYEAYFISK